MTKQHFIALADTIKYAKGSPGEFTAEQIHELARFCKSQNGNFNTARWLGYIAGTCGQNGGKV